MSILKRFQNLNNFTDKENFYEVFFRKLHIGYIHKIVAEQFFNISLPICICNKKFHILEANGKKVNIIMREIGEFLLHKNFITSLSGELFPCVKNLGKREYFCLDRSLVEMLGIKGYGVHLKSTCSAPGDFLRYSRRKCTFYCFLSLDKGKSDETDKKCESSYEEDHKSPFTRKEDNPSMDPSAVDEGLKCDRSQRTIECCRRKSF